MASLRLTASLRFATVANEWRKKKRWGGEGAWGEGRTKGNEIIITIINT